MSVGDKQHHRMTNPPLAQIQAIAAPMPHPTNTAEQIAHCDWLKVSQFGLKMPPSFCRCLTLGCFGLIEPTCTAGGSQSGWGGVLFQGGELCLNPHFSTMDYLYGEFR